MGLNFYSEIVRFVGVGILVLITGFANAVVFPAINIRSKNFIIGMVAKIFIVARPVIVFGMLVGVI